MLSLLYWLGWVLAGGVLLHLLDPAIRSCRQRVQRFQGRQDALPSPVSDVADDPPEPDSLPDVPEAQTAAFYFRRAFSPLAIAREIGDRSGEGSALGNLGLAYSNLGDARGAIGYHEQALAIAREIGDAVGAASTSFNLARLLSGQGQRAEALRHAEYAAQVFQQIGHEQNAQMAQQLVARIRE